MSAATADRILREHRNGGRRYGISTTKAGKLLKNQVPLRTFSDWDEVKPTWSPALGPLQGGRFCTRWY
jgi:hypothetical protein